MEKIGKWILIIVVLNFFLLEAFAADPILENCPNNLIFIIPPGGEVNFNLIAPKYYDDEGLAIISSQYVITYPDGSQEGPFDFQSEEVLSFSLTDEGLYSYNWVVTNIEEASSECQNTVQLKLTAEDPILENCPNTFGLNIPDNGIVEFNIIAPSYYDPCGLEIISSQYLITYPDGSQEGPFDFQSEEFLSFSLTDEGLYYFDWVVTNIESLSSECQNTLELGNNWGDLSYIHKTEPTEVIACSSGGVSIPIQVSGIGDMNQYNGLWFVWLSGNLEGGFQGQISLTNPAGNEFILASSSYGSFPEFEGTSMYNNYEFAANFQDCSNNLPPHDTPANTSEILSGTFTPAEPWHIQNDGTNADGIWYLNVCKDDADVFFGWRTISLAFGSICPYITELELTNPSSCDESDGSVSLIAVQRGSCTGNGFGYAFSIDDGMNWQLNSADFNELAAGDYTMVMAHQLDGEIQGDCISPLEFSIEYEDLIAPQIFNCPNNMNIEITESQTTNWSVTQPDYSDNCFLESAIVTAIYPDGSELQLDIIPGELLMDSYNEIGDIIYVWEVVDEIGNTSICETVISIIPIYETMSLEETSEVDTDGVSMLDGQFISVSGLSLGINGLNNKFGRSFIDGLSFVLVSEDNYGIGVFNESNSFEYSFQEGDELNIKGSIQQFNGLIEIAVDSISVLSLGNSLPQATSVNELGEETESALVKVESLYYLDPNQWKGNGSTFYVDLSNGIQTFSVKIDSNSELSTKEIISAPFDLIGIGSQDDPEIPFLDNYELIPRYESDFVLISSSVIGDLQNTQISIFPNPVNRILHVDSNEDIDLIYLIDINGQKILKENCSKEIDVSSLDNGLYYLISEIKDKKITKPIIVNN
jgi:hypothetical protein